MRLFFFTAAELMVAFLSKVVVVVVVVARCSCLGFLTSRVEIRGKEWSRMVGLVLECSLLPLLLVVLCPDCVVPKVHYSTSTLPRELGSRVADKA